MHVPSITPALLAWRMAEEPSLMLLDVRTPVEHAEAHLPRAVNIPLAELRPESLEIPKDREVCLLCHSGGRATKAAEQLSRAGFSQVLVVEGGMESWIAAGLPVKRSGGKVISLERQVRIVAGSLVFLGVLGGSFLNPFFFLLSGFVGAGLVFAGISGWCGMGMLLARLPWNSRRS